MLKSTFSSILLAMLVAIMLMAGAGPAQAFLSFDGTTPHTPSPADVTANPPIPPDYLTTPNWANSPPLRKFVDPLPGLCDPATQNCNDGVVDGINNDRRIPVAVPDTTTYPGSDYYVIELRQFQQQMHSDLPPTTLRGYIQVNLGTDAGGANTIAPANEPHYLGPIILASKDRPVRILFKNMIAPATDGDLFLPVDNTVMGSGPYEIDYDPVTKAPLATPMIGNFSTNRATLHLHGGRTPWISDGTPHQWITPASENAEYAKGVSVVNVPDMPDPGPGAQTFYYTNQQSARLMFYHDHAWGITRLNVYAGEAAGYLIGDAVEARLVADGIIPGAAETLPLVIQDKTFVDANPASESYIGKTDPTWNWGMTPGTPHAGDLWWPHIYMPAQNPFDITGIAPMGRWAYGPYFWPATNNPYQPIPNPYFNPNCDPAYDPNGDGTLTMAEILANTATISGYTYIADTFNPDGTPASATAYCQPPEIPSTPNPSWGAEAFLDTAVVNGVVYPTVTLEPKAYRLRLLNAAHDRFLNLQLYKADATLNPNTPSADQVGTPYDEAALTSASAALCGNNCATDTEVRMLPALDFTAQGAPATWPADGRAGGVPDWTAAGPSWVMIGNEGGFLPQPVVIPNNPITWNTDPTTFNAGNINGGALMLGPAERADVIVDLSAYAGQTLILYNDAPAPWPALDPHYDYYTGAPDNRAMGGANTLLPGFGPNIRTIMQIRVAGTVAPTYDLAKLQDAFDPTVDTSGLGPNYVQGVFQQAQDTVVVGQTAYNKTYNRSGASAFPSNYPNWGISRINDKGLNFIGGDGSTAYQYDAASTATYPWDPAKKTNGALPMAFKAIHDEQGATFDDYGRMRAALGLELATAGNLQVNFIVQTYSDPSTEKMDPNGIQIWKITHNGVDTHPIHFHLFDVQVLNRVGWDGFVRLPDPTELGWKETVRISPLEDTIVAIKPVEPRVPFGVPESYRPLNPATPIGSTVELSMVDPATGNAWATPNLNRLLNFDWEYVWHCHILSHEENDMMRPIVFNVPENFADAPVLSDVSLDPTVKIDLSWTDPTPVNYITGSGFGDSRGEIRFRVERCEGQDCSNFTEYATTLANSTTYSDSAVLTGNYYSYRVVAVNAAGDSPVSNVIQVGPALPVATVPNPPTIGTATAGNAQATVSFTPPVWNGGSTITLYTVTSNDGIFATGTTSPITVTGLTNGTAYTFTVTATNAIGTSLPSATSNSVIPATVPDAPVIGTATAGNTQATVTYTAPLIDGGSAITGYTATANPGGKTATVVSGPITVTGLTNGTPYTFTVTATNAIGTSSPSASSNSVTPDVVPAAPTIGTATAAPGQATVTFTPPAANGGTPILDYTMTSAPGGITATGTGSPIIVTGLTNGTTYTFTVTARNALGSGSPSVSSNAVTPLAVPDAPTIGVATAGNAQAIVTFTPPTANGGSPIIVYTVTSNPAGATAVGLGSPIVVTGLSNGTPYTFTVTAINAVGVSAPSAASNSVTPDVVPAAPTIGTATAGAGQANVTYSAPAPNGGTAILDYTAVSSPGGITATGTANPLVVTGLTNGTSYTFTVTARNALGSGPASAASNSVVPTASMPATPGATLTVRNSVVSLNPPTVTLTWADRSSNEASFEIQRATNSIFTLGLTTFTASMNQVSFIDATVAERTLYYYRVRAVNNVGTSSWSNIASITTVGRLPKAPTDLAFVSATYTAITLSWTDNADNEARFVLQRSLTGAAGTWVTVVSTIAADTDPAPSTSAYTNTGLTHNTTYWYRVQAANTSGVSTYSNVISGKTLSRLPLAPTNLVFVGSTFDTATLTWTDNSDTETRFVLQRSLNGTTWATVAYPLADADPAPSATIYTNTGLTHNTTYWYRVAASNAYGNSTYSNVVSGKTVSRLPLAPTNLTFDSSTINAITMSWTDNASNETGFTVQRSTSATGPWATIANVTAATALAPSLKTYTNTGLLRNTTYWYQVRAYNAYGSSAFTTPTSGTTQP